MDIGGYLGLEEFMGKEYYPDLIALNTGRNALACLIHAKHIRKLYIPNYLCDSVFRVCEREECPYEFYEVGADFLPKFEKALGNGEWIYIVNYFGQILNERELKKKYDRIIFDNAQAFFQEPVEGISTIYSCRKFFGVPDGAYLAAEDVPELDVDISKHRMAHILGRYEGMASDYYKDFRDNDKSFSNLAPGFMSRLTHNILRAIDYKKVKERREENFLSLHGQLKGANRLNIQPPAGPYMYPFYMEKGLEVKKKLAAKRIYIPTLWPNAVEFGGVAKDYSENILPLPCDQRYSFLEMRTIVDAVCSFL
ncbi:hypothetical protein [uncultured Acetatifactor sp.]|jgi:hypothetical protein|uniref:hypothetical protein n=1 Tax=uncultured Acetatifactor sp. TaxID=1671927 RepID=UPI002610A638|nr:hypothetical protein [uncultured Acetatifactor sp.]